MKCKICELELKNTLCLSTHIFYIHKIKSKEYYDMYLKKEKEGICLTCGGVTKFIGLGIGYRQFCCIKCQTNSSKFKDSIRNFFNNKDRVEKRKLLMKQTCIKKYGVDNPMKVASLREKLKQTNIKRYGVEVASQSQQVKNTYKQTCMQRYGVEHPSKLESVKEKCKSTFQKKYGVDNPFLDRKKIENIFMEKYGKSNPSLVKKFQEKRTQTFIKKYGVANPSFVPEVKKRIGDIQRKNYYENFIYNLKYKPLFTLDEYKGSTFLYRWECKQCGCQFDCYFQNGRTLHCPQCEPTKRSKGQQEICDFLRHYDNNIDQNTRKLFDENLEIDFYIPTKNIAIEYNGNYYHSEINGNKDKNYHLSKTIKCLNKNIKLIHIFEDEWLFKKNIVKSRLRSILQTIKYSIYARKCYVKEIDTQLKNKFLNKYHIQGEDKSMVKLGLFYKNRVVAVMTFGALRKALGQNNKIGCYELVRYATVSNFNIIGGASKLLSFFENLYKPCQLISYADRRWSQGNLYYKLGFGLDHISPPNYWYMGGKYGFLKREHRFNFRKNVLENKLKKFDRNKSEWENMRENKYDRIWDCGNLVFKKIYNNQ